MQDETVLIVDDNPETLAMERIVLEIAGFRVATAESAQDAFRRLTEVQPDLILVDVLMGEDSGIEFIEQLKRSDQESLRNVPVVLLSGLPNVPESKATGFIPKGCDIDELVNSVRHFIKVGNKREPGSAQNTAQNTDRLAS